MTEIKMKVKGKNKFTVKMKLIIVRVANVWKHFDWPTTFVYRRQLSLNHTLDDFCRSVKKELIVSVLFRDCEAEIKFRPVNNSNTTSQQKYVYYQWFELNQTVKSFLLECFDEPTINKSKTFEIEMLLLPSLYLRSPKSPAFASKLLELSCCDIHIKEKHAFSFIPFQLYIDEYIRVSNEFFGIDTNGMESWSRKSHKNQFNHTKTSLNTQFVNIHDDWNV